MQLEWPLRKCCRRVGIQASMKMHLSFCSRLPQPLGRRFVFKYEKQYCYQDNHIYMSRLSPRLCLKNQYTYSDWYPLSCIRCYNIVRRIRDSISYRGVVNSLAGPFPCRVPCPISWENNTPSTLNWWHYIVLALSSTPITFLSTVILRHRARYDRVETVFCRVWDLLVIVKLPKTDIIWATHHDAN